MIRKLLVIPALALALAVPASAQTPGSFVGLSTGHTAPLTAAALNAAFATKQDVALRVVTASGAIIADATDYIIVVNKAVGAATSVTLPTAAVSGKIYVVKDGKGDAAVNNITIFGSIDGATNLVMNLSYEAVTLAWNGSGWSII